MWKDQKKSMHQRSPTEGLHSEGKCGITKCLDGAYVIVAHKQRHVQCYKVPNAFVNTDIDKDVLMVLKGELAEMMVHIAPQIYCNTSLLTRRAHLYCM